MEVHREDNRFCIEAQGIYASFPDSEANRKTVVVLLRWLRHSRERCSFVYASGTGFDSQE